MQGKTDDFYRLVARMRKAQRAGDRTGLPPLLRFFSRKWYERKVDEAILKHYGKKNTK